MTSIKQRLILGSLLLGSLAVPALASADAMTTPVATPTPTWYQKITVGGYLDAYYQLNLVRPSDTQASSVEPLQYRTYDNTENQFTLGGGELTLKQNDAASGTGYFVDLLMGSINSVYGTNASSDSLGLGQAYVTQAFGNATFTLGKFGTPIGYELTYLPSNANFSRSLLYAQEPTYSTGLSVAYTLPASFVATLWADDGNSVDNAINNGKGYGAQLAYSGIKNLNLTGTYYLLDNVSEVNNGTNTGLYRNEMTNFVATYTATESLNFAGEYLNKTAVGLAASDSAYSQSQGYALYATYNTPVANLSVSPRFEQWFNPNVGIAGAEGYPVNYGTYPNTNPYQLNDYTLTVKYQMGPLAHMLEYRCDASNRYEFVTGNVGTGTPTFSQLQQTLTYAAVYSF